MSMLSIIQKSIQLYDTLVDMLIKYVYDVLLLILRVYIASIFFQSGWNKFENLLEGGWFKTVFLFKSVYKLPVISPEVAAVLGTGAELIFSIFLALGILTRIGALGLLGVTAVITFGVRPHFTHEFWALLLGVSFIMGAGKFSFDGWLRSWWTRLHSGMQYHLDSTNIRPRKAPNIISKDRPNEKIMLDNKKEPIVKRRLSKRKLVAEPDTIVSIKSLVKNNSVKSSRRSTQKPA